MFRPGCRFLAALLCTELLAACASTVEKWNPDDYTVKSGDSVYSIAWRYELDPEEFAAWNNLGSSKLSGPASVYIPARRKILLRYAKQTAARPV